MIEDSRNLFPNGSEITLRHGEWSSYEFTTGESFAAPVHRFPEKEYTVSYVYGNEMFYITEDGYAMALFDESDWWINYDKKVHSGMTVQALLRKYIAWDGVPYAMDFQTLEEANDWLRQWGYYPCEY